MPTLVNTRATFRDELLLFELSDIETWSCQAFARARSQARGCSMLPTPLQCRSST